MCNEYTPHHLAGRQVEMRARLQILISKILTCAPWLDARRLSTLLSFSFLASLVLSTCPFTCTRKNCCHFSQYLRILRLIREKSPHPRRKLAWTKHCPCHAILSAKQLRSESLDILQIKSRVYFKLGSIRFYHLPHTKV